MFPSGRIENRLAGWSLDGKPIGLLDECEVREIWLSTREICKLTVVDA